MRANMIYGLVVAAFALAALVLEPPLASAEYPVKRLTYMGGVNGGPEWSPDGTIIAFQHRDSGDYDIYTIPAMGGTPTRLTYWPYDQGQPSYSPDGQYIAFTWRTIPFQDDDVYIMPKDAGSYINFTNSGGYDALPAWSPKGDEIAFVSERNAPYWSHIWVQPYPSGAARQITFNLDAQCPSWSPDANYVAFNMWVTQSTYDVDIFTIPAAGGTPVNVTNTPGIKETAPSWSPDGQYIAYERFDPANPNTDIYMCPASGGTPVRLTDNAKMDYWPKWSRDGSRIAFVSARDNAAGELYILCLAENVQPSSLGKIKALFR